jgi:uncharacterized delta-60 repeat protein
MRGIGHQIFGWRWLAPTCAVLLVSVSGAPAWAAPGDMDPTFGDEGWVSTLAPNREAAGAMTILPDGKIVVVGMFGSQMAAWRYLPSGQPDATFGADGVQTVAIDRVHEIEDVVAQPDGKLVVGGRLIRYPMVARLMPDGSLDLDFGGGDGFVTIRRPRQSFSNYWYAIDVSMFSDGGILTEYAGVARYRERSFLMRLSSDGVPDPAFGRNGRLPIGRNSYASIALVDAGILVAGEDPASIHRLVVSRYLFDGTVDASFGTEGRGSYYLALRRASALAVGTDSLGRVILAGAGWMPDACGTRETEVLRLMPNGERDSSFTPFTGCFEPVSLQLSAGGSTIVVGFAFTGGGSGEYQLWISKLRVDGLPDLAFGDQGSVVAAPEQAYWLTARDADLQSDGKLVVMGPAIYEQAFLLGRLLVA